jgi:hypothetical protein
VASIEVKLIPKGDDQFNQEERTRKKKYILLKNIQSERIVASSYIRDLNKHAS